jgi:hypothetical protein
VFHLCAYAADLKADAAGKGATDIERDSLPARGFAAPIGLHNAARKSNTHSAAFLESWGGSHCCGALFEAR